ncbi:hypothetical protein [Brevibacterium sp. SMBL_HHYL_HB1]|uniref:hypothetical protein n=1 Tax=Brevibacterium sp. SMBL_HHYL_HB1 TaxID=2777556 RepID=UPI002012BD5E|nr:hypothetical protein [Brevibacterium sp. SMBL_HHYL_HB1]
MVRHPVCARSHTSARVSMSFGSVPAAANRAGQTPTSARPLSRSVEQARATT